MRLIPSIIGSGRFRGITLDSQESGGAGHRNIVPVAGTLTLTWSFTNTAGNLLVVGINGSAGSAANTTITSVKYGTDALTSAISNSTWDTSGNNQTAIYYKIDPLTGTNTVEVIVTSAGGGLRALAGALSFSGHTGTAVADTQVGGDGGGTGTHATTAAFASPLSGDYIVGVGAQGSGNAMTADGVQSMSFSLAGSGDTAGDDIACVIQQSSGSSITPGFTWTGADHWGMVAAQFH